jgi:hypothetical protein
MLGFYELTPKSSEICKKNFLRAKGQMQKLTEGGVNVTYPLCYFICLFCLSFVIAS